MDAPQVTGVAALLKSCAPDLTTAQIKQYILEETIYTSSLAGKVLTNGRLNPYDTIINALMKGVSSNRNTTLVAGQYRYSNTDNVGCFLKTGSSSAAFITWDATTSTSNIESSAKVHWTSSSFNYANIQDRIVSGDFNGDGKDDIAAFYYYGNNQTTMFMWRGSSSGFTLLGQSSRWTSSSFDATKINYRVVSNDCDGSGKDDIIVIYQLSNTVFRMFVWRGNTTSASLTSSSGIGDFSGYSASNMSRKLVSIDIDHNTLEDIWFLYNADFHWLWSSAGDFYMVDYL